MKKTFFLLLLISLWCQLNYSQTIIDSVEVKSGWNIIGALESGEINFPASNITLDLILTEPPGIISSPFWGFIPGAGYFQADSLRRGIGYWVKVSQDGKIKYMSFTDCGTVDYDGKIYNTVLIGNQCWLKENLNLGTMIPNNQNSTDNGVLEKYCYDNDPNNCSIYGGLFTWGEMMEYNTTPGSQGICPAGWHIPTDTEFQSLFATVSNDGNALKAIGQGTGTNTSGFSALLGGLRRYDGAFDYLGTHSLFWTSSSTATNTVTLYADNSNITLNGSGTAYGYYVRCLKD